MNGILLLNKPKNCSSYHLVAKAKKILNQKKIGHAGTLDPLASGLLILLIGKGTRISEFIMSYKKTYTFDIHLGLLSDTGDFEGNILKKEPSPMIDPNSLMDKLCHFKGHQKQIAPKFSALKHKGKPSYYYARKGIEIPEKVRNIEISEIELIAINENIISLKATCSSGTYVRTLGQDIANSLNTVGVVDNIVRQAVGPFELVKALDLVDQESLIHQFLLPLDVPFFDMDALTLGHDESIKYKNGVCINLDRAKQKNVRVYGSNDEFIGVGHINKFNTLEVIKNLF